MNWKSSLEEFFNSWVSVTWFAV